VTVAASIARPPCCIRTDTTDTVRPSFSTSVSSSTGPGSGARRKSVATASGSGAEPGASSSTRASPARASSTISSPPWAFVPMVQCDPSSAPKRPPPSGVTPTAARKGGCGAVRAAVVAATVVSEPWERIGQAYHASPPGHAVTSV
jgi:hypothetical protein